MSSDSHECTEEREEKKWSTARFQIVRERSRSIREGERKRKKEKKKKRTTATASDDDSREEGEGERMTTTYFASSFIQRVDDIISHTTLMNAWGLCNLEAR